MSNYIWYVESTKAEWGTPQAILSVYLEKVVVCVAVPCSSSGPPSRFICYESWSVKFIPV